MKNAPAGYQCPFCHLAETLQAPTPKREIILVEPRVFAFVPLHHYAGIRGNCLVAPRAHYENVLDIPDELGSDFFRATRLIANAMRDAFGCEGISTRQHNGPAGNQDVWHFHLHVFPRFRNDGLYGGDAALYGTEERLEVAERLRDTLEGRLRKSPDASLERSRER
jgi:histidine triad (HIT) family protein